MVIITHACDYIIEHFVGNNIENTILTTYFLVFAQLMFASLFKFLSPFSTPTVPYRNVAFSFVL